MTNSTNIRLEVDESNLVNNLRHAFTKRSNVLSELMQNGRRAGATEIRFTIGKDKLTIEDNGKGIDDFSDLLTVASSGWDIDTIQKESPFGLGFLAALYACKNIQIESNGTLLEADTDSILNQEMIGLSHSLVRVGTIISLMDLDYDFEQLENDIKSLSAGFPIQVFINDDEVLRPHAQENLIGANTDIGFMHLTGIHNGSWKPNKYTLVYLQGLPIWYNGNRMGPLHHGRHSSYFHTPFGLAGCPQDCNIVHLDSEKYIARVPDRDVLIDSDEFEKTLTKVVSQQFWNCFTEEKELLSSQDFIKRRWELAHSMNHRDISFNYKAFFNDIPLVPEDVFKVVHDYPYILREDEEPEDFLDDLSSSNQFISKEDFESNRFIVLGMGVMEDTYYEPSNAIAYMFALGSENTVIYSSDYSVGLHDDHWLHDYIETIEDCENHFSYKLIGKNLNIIKFEGDWIKEMDINFVIDCDKTGTQSACEITHTKSGQVVSIEDDAFILPNKVVFFPEREKTSKVVTQALRWSDEGSWCDDEQDNEETLLSRFVLSERAKDPEALLQVLLNSQKLHKYSALSGMAFNVSIDLSGKLDVTMIGA